MRTTLTIDDDLFRLLEDEMARSRRTFKQVVSDTLRRGLGVSRSPAAPFRVAGRDLQLRAGIDEGRFNQLVDELECDEVVAGYRQDDGGPAHGRTEAGPVLGKGKARPGQQAGKVR